ncbi:M20 peptidase aminoacylase family protein [Tenuibacillus multivorans]|uniref:Amidohydrolase n=1 Tax=Tenuibacillus multivorans TaxID=237069 RepID=A0A1H0C419_9BACI|nr:M20 peptidase aminoacylase family protein [Tenuibacillus multivorans]GEL77759.1 amidohydrolase AmhX [Tenuibacillus multivorans]SDN52634.1 amidohydrolase [Tenuibacillus multivorans]
MNKLIESLKPQLIDIFNHLHTYPEISWEEVKTTEYIENLLENEGINVKTFSDCTGLVAEIGHGKPVVAVRADIDALWQQVDGEFQANHSCGHDAHMTIVLGTLLAFHHSSEAFNGTVRFIFQPAEEKGTGALKLVEKGVVDDVNYLYGMHLRPKEELNHGEFTPVIKHGAARFIHGTITGEDAHGARPHLTANAIDIGADLNHYIRNIQVNPMIPHSIKMTGFQAGGKSQNIIPGSATFSLDLRAQTNEAMDQINDKLNQVVHMLEEYHQVKIELELGANVAASVTNNEAISHMAEGIQRAAGEDALKDPIVTTGGDDFHFYTIERPHLKATMLGIGCDLGPGLHHPNMTFNFNAIPKSVEVMVETVRRTLG